MTARFRVVGRFDRVGVQEATVLVDRAAGLFTVRPLRRRKTYTLPLSTIAEIVVARITKAEVAREKAEKRARRRGRL